MDRKPSEEQFVCFNIRDFLNSEESGGIGENDLEKILSDFLSPKNPDVESFLRKRKLKTAKMLVNQEFTVIRKYLQQLIINADRQGAIEDRELITQTSHIKNASNRLKNKEIFDICLMY